MQGIGQPLLLLSTIVTDLKSYFCALGHVKQPMDDGTVLPITIMPNFFHDFLGLSPGLEVDLNDGSN